MNKDYEVLKRIDSLLSKKGVKQQDLIEYLGLARGAYSNWNRMTSNSYLSYLGEKAEFFEVNPNYLVTGKDDLSSKTILHALTDEEEQIIEQYRRIPKKHREIASKLLIALQE